MTSLSPPLLVARIHDPASFYLIEKDKSTRPKRSTAESNSLTVRKSNINNGVCG